MRWIIPETQVGLIIHITLTTVLSSSKVFTSGLPGQPHWALKCTSLCNVSSYPVIIGISSIFLCFLEEFGGLKKKNTHRAKIKNCIMRDYLLSTYSTPGSRIFLRERGNSNFKVLGCAAFGQLFNKNKYACNRTLYQTLSPFCWTKLNCAWSCEETCPSNLPLPWRQGKLLTVKLSHQVPKWHLL